MQRTFRQAPSGPPVTVDVLQTGDGNPEGVVIGPTGDVYVDRLNGQIYSKIQGALALGWAPTGTFTVASETDFAGFRGRPGAYGFVLGQGSWWASRDGQTLAPVPGQIVNGSGCQWIRLPLGHPQWLPQNGKTTWLVNGTTGNNNNDGSPGAPVASVTEITRRFGTLPTFADADVAITLQTSLPSDRPIFTGNYRTANTIRLLGTPIATLHSGTISAVTAINRATQTYGEIQDAGVGTFAPFIGQRARTITGANSGATTGLGKLNAATAARTGPWQNFNPAAGPPALPSNVTPAINDQYVIESLPTLGGLFVQMGSLSSLTSRGPFLVDSIDFFQTQSLMMFNTGFSSDALWVTRSRLTSTLGFDGGVFFVSCCAPALIVPNPARNGSFWGCTMIGGLGAPYLENVRSDRDTLWQGVVGSVSVWDVTFAVGTICSVDGFAVADSPEEGFRLRGGFARMELGTLLWGNGNTLTGGELNNGAVLATSGAEPSLTGAGGDWLVSGLGVLAYAALPAASYGAGPTGAGLVGP